MKIPRYLIYLLISGFIFVALVSYNYFTARSRQDNQPSTFSVDMLKYPSSLISGEAGNFEWQVNTNSSFKTNMTTIYWSYTSSPSAFMNLVHPAQAGYSSFASDYAQGEFSLPDTFQANIAFNQPGTIFFRAYSRINDRNYWSPEYSLEVK